jgi:glycerophosphoryl diester phosphodiesterase
MKIWGHRGCRGPTSPPENSIRAFREAILHGADGVELDVFATRDGHLIVFHDDVLEGRSDGYGAVSSRTLDEIRALRLKSHMGELTNDGIPTLGEALDVIEAWKQEARRSGQDNARAANFVVNIETKGLGIAAYVAAEVERRLASGWLHRNFLNSSFDLRSLREMRQLFSELPIGALFEGPLPHPAAPWDITIEELTVCVAEVADIRPDTINITLPSLRQPGAVDLIRRSGARSVAWTSDEVAPQMLSPSELHDLMYFLSDNDIIFITDFPGPMRELERTHRSQVGSERRQESARPGFP